MQSYNSPGRVITVANSGPGAVAVRRDQPYRLGLLVGVTQAAAAIDEDLNLCVEGVYEQMVDLADGVSAAEAGDPVLMNVATFALVAGLTDTVDHISFGVLAERMTRRRVALVKLMLAAAAAPASGGGDAGGGSNPAKDAEQDARLDALEAGAGSGGGGAVSGIDTAAMRTAAATFQDAGAQFALKATELVRAGDGDVTAVFIPGGNNIYFATAAAGWYSLMSTFSISLPERKRIAIFLAVYNSQGGLVSNRYYGMPGHMDPVGLSGFKADNFGLCVGNVDGIVFAPAGGKIAVRLLLLENEETYGGGWNAPITVNDFTTVARRVA